MTLDDFFRVLNPILAGIYAGTALGTLWGMALCARRICYAVERIAERMP